MHWLRGKQHNYLIMWLDYLVPGEVRISTEDYPRGVLDDFPEKITESPETPALTKLLKIREENECEPLE